MPPLGIFTNPPSARKGQNGIVLFGRARILDIAICEEILSKGYEVTLILENGFEPFARFKKNPKFTIRAKLPKTKKFTPAKAVIYTREISVDNTKDLKEAILYAKSSNSIFILSSTLDVYKGVISSVSLDGYFGPPDTAFPNFEIIEAYRCAESIVVNFHRQGLKAVILRTGCVYGPGMDLKLSYPLGTWVENSLKKGVITVIGNGLAKRNYVYAPDAARAFRKSIETNKALGKILSIGEKKPITDIELAYLIRSILNNKVDVKTIGKKGQIDFPQIPESGFKNSSLISWKPKTKLKDGLKETITPLLKETNKEKMSLALNDDSEEAEKKKNNYLEHKGRALANLLHGKKSTRGVAQTANKKRKLFNIGIILASIAFLALIPTVYFSINAYLGISRLKKSVSLAKNHEFSKAAEYSDKAASNLKEALNTPKTILFIEDLLKYNTKWRAYDLQSLLRASYYAAEIENHTLSAGEEAITVFSNISPNTRQTSISEATFEKIGSHVKAVGTNIDLFKGEVSKIDPKILGRYQKDIDLIFEMENLIKSSTGLIDNLYTILGYDGEKKYLILFQNSSELRATGGFIGSYASVNLLNGKIQSLVVDDIYNIDGQLDEKNINIKPPKPIQVMLSQNNLRIRDANWDPFFPYSAQTILSLFEKADGRKYNGVVALDTFFLKTLLGITGEVYLPFYDLKVNENNVYEKTQYYSETNYFEGSALKKTFLSNLVYKVLKKLFETESITQKAALGIYNSLEQKHIFIYTPQTPFFAKNGYDGGKKPSEGDYLFIVDSNLGGTKANYYIKRSSSYSIKRSKRDGTLFSTLLINYEHTGSPDAWPGGAYRNYLRVLVPQGAKLLSAYAFQSGRKTDILNGVVLNETHGLTSFETGFELQAKKSLTVEFSYSLPPTVLKNGSLSNGYNLVVQKQGGTDSDPFSFIFNIPFGKTVIKAPKPSQITDNDVKISTNLKGDLEINILLK